MNTTIIPSFNQGQYIAILRRFPLKRDDLEDLEDLGDLGEVFGSPARTAI
ncbi:MAG: hypothetical protein DSM106950_01595 [Stigonema ocellatum SAG 48.90 = DSM 106950]|nr:hypothetical protein [Stigonema ocellatum SAG 48.90 = DSM 106950]